MPQLFTNNATGKLLNQALSTDATLTLQTGQGARFPSPSGGDFCLVTMYEAGEVNHEIVRCTARSGDVLTVTRAQEGTTARTFAIGTPVELRVTAATMKQATNYANLVAQEADSTTTGGNARGVGAVDLQTLRTAASQVASGSRSVAMGEGNTASGVFSVAIGAYNTVNVGYAVAMGSSNTAGGNHAVAMGSSNTASGNHSVAMGLGNTASGSYAVAMGLGNTASGQRSVVMGIYGSTNIDAKRVQGAGAAAGTVQTGETTLSATTTDATATRLRSNNSAADATNQLTLPNNSAHTFDGLVIVRQQASGGTQTAAWRVEGIIRREGTAATTTLVASTVTAISNAPGWVLALTADTTNGALAVTFTGAAATNIRCVATLRTAETIYA